jgi:broad specificity phosphatase PhoE
MAFQTSEMQTTDILRQSLPWCALEFEDSLRERNLGDLHGMDVTGARSVCPEGLQALKSRNPESRIPGGGESLKELEERVSLSISILSKRCIGAFPGCLKLTA